MTPIILGMGMISPSSGLLGVGSPSTSLTTYPKTGSVTTGDYYVDGTSGNDSNSGTSLGAAFKTIGKALSVVSAGGVILVRGGTYTLSSRITRNTTWGSTVKVFAYGTERPVIDASGLGSGSSGRALYFQSSAKYEHWKGFKITGAPEVSIQIEGQYITIEDFHVTRGIDTGIYIGNFGGGAGNNLIQDCAVWRLGDGTSTGTNTPDCIAVTANSGSTSNDNAVVRCAVFNGGDDGIDFYRAKNTIAWDCVAAGCGYYWNGNSAGDGNGFKAGGSNAGVGPNTVKGCFTIGNKQSGINDNSSTNGPTFTLNTATETVRGFINDLSTDSYNISYNNPTYNQTSTHGTNNSWNLGAANPKFESDYSLGSTSPYLDDGPSSTPIGASEIALKLFKDWAGHSEIYIP